MLRMGTSTMKQTLEQINEKIFQAVQKRSPNICPGQTKLPRLVAVSKFQPVELIIEAYGFGQRHFGENYIQELVDKANNDKLRQLCPDIRWHFIGRLQSNKVNKLLKVPNLEILETVDSEKLAKLVNKAFTATQKLQSQDSNNSEEANTGDALEKNKLKVMVQVKTSDEDRKSGVAIDHATQLARYIQTECDALEFTGLMTIGKLSGWGEGQANQDFIRLRQCREIICHELDLEPEMLELSMGMSSDFEEAIEAGSTNIRIGTMIFGERKS